MEELVERWHEPLRCTCTRKLNITQKTHAHVMHASYVILAIDVLEVILHLSPETFQVPLYLKVKNIQKRIS